MHYLWVPLQASLVVIVGALILIALANMRTLRRLGEYPPPAEWPRVSILVPARDEEINAEACLRSLLAQDYPDFEVLVLDDNSVDRTAEILTRLAAEDPRLRVLAGRPLPPGWLGKNWACHQLLPDAGGELLLFTDVDTCHHPRSLADAVAALSAEGADLLTVFPKQQVVSWAERLIVPVLSLCFFLFLPLALAYRTRQPGLSITIGQFMLFRRRAYEQIGGHAAVRHDVVEDQLLGQRIKEHGLRWRVADGCTRVHCRMYRNMGEVLEGFGKNLFPSFGYNLPGYLFVWLLVATLALEPLAVLLLRLCGAPISDLSTALAAGTVGGSLVLAAVSYPRFAFPLYLAFLYPFTTLVALGVAAHSLALTLTGRSTWKGRQIVRQRTRWW